MPIPAGLPISMAIIILPITEYIHIVTAATLEYLSIPIPSATIRATSTKSHGSPQSCRFPVGFVVMATTTFKVVMAAEINAA